MAIDGVRAGMGIDGVRAGTGTRPYENAGVVRNIWFVNHNNPVKMIGHYLKFINSDVWIMLRYFRKPVHVLRRISSQNTFPVVNNRIPATGWNAGEIRNHATLFTA